MFALGAVIALLSCVHIIFCTRILGVFPVPSISHQVVYRAISTQLARSGHQVVVVTPDPVKNHNISNENFKQIDVHDLSYGIWHEMLNFAQLRGASDSPKDLCPLLKDVTVKILDAQLKTKEVKAILGNSSEQFDLLLLESLVQANFGWSWQFKTPLIGISSMSGLLSNFDSTGNPSHPAFYPDIFSVKVGKLDIWDKINAVYSDLWIRYVDYYFRDRDNAVVRKHFGEDTPSVHTLEVKMDMLFLNVHPLLAGIRPAVPALVYMGGLHLQPKKKKLPKDLQSFLDDSPQGVVYMSLGSNVMSKDLPPETLQMVLDVFRGLPYSVLWKFEEDLPNRPSNVMISKWLPQQDLLGHPNIKAFITQGGLQSLEEAIRDHVPLIGIPFLADQDFNVQNIVRHGIGVGLNFNRLNKEDFEKAVLSVTKDPKYKESVRRLAGLLSDQPMQSLERAVWWTEYVLRHRGARHLRAPAAGVSLVEYFLLDVIAVFAALAAAAALVVGCLVWLMYALVKDAWRRKVKTN